MRPNPLLTLLTVCALSVCALMPPASSAAERRGRAGRASARSQSALPSARTRAQAGPASASVKKFALLIGISDYMSSTVTDLSGCENDVSEMKSLLVEQYKFPDTPENIRVLLSSNRAADAKPTRANIIAAVNSFLIEKARTNPGAIVVFYYSGHGSTADDVDGGTARPAIKKDEGDGIDETLVASDSRDSFRKLRNGRSVPDFTGTGDIIDDEVDGWFGALSTHTQNITFILDSCHSGSATRGDAAVPRKVKPAAGNPQAAALEGGGARRVGGERNLGNGSAPTLRTGASRIQNYAAISGCAPEQLSYEVGVPVANGRMRKQGVMTFSLVQVLRVKPASTYRELREKLPTAVGDMGYNYQTPQVEGDLDRYVFGGADERARPYARVLNVSTDSVTVNLGTVHGVRKDAFISLYKPEATKLQGAEDRVAVAQVVTSNPFSSVAKVTEASGAVSTASKVVLATPYFSGDKLVVALDTAPGARGAVPPPPAALVAAVQGRADANIVEFASMANPFARANEARKWDVTLVQDTYSKFLEDRNKQPTRGPLEPGMNDPVVYLTSRSGLPLFDLWFRPDSPDTPAKIADALNKRARQLGVKGLRNDGSPLGEQLKMSLHCVKGQVNTNDITEKTAEDSLDSAGVRCDRDFNANEGFVLEFQNTSGKDLFLTVLTLGTSGNIQQAWPPVGRELKLVAGQSVTTDALWVGPPSGVESLKIIATNSYVDFTPLLQASAMRSTTESRGSKTPFARLFDRATNKTRDVAAGANPGLDEWATKDVDIIIRAQ
ncbi:MAG TPA: caspase family protein [Pyrinomonadaceae bacterium]|nr:caspase family protein [Pyrinomonadaceae bacterium]